MSTTPTYRTRPYRLTIDNVSARSLAARGEIVGSTFLQVTPRSYSTLRAAQARAKNILVEQYDPAVPYEAQPRATVVDHDHGATQTFVMVPYLGFYDVAIVDDALLDSSDNRRAEHTA